MSGLVVYLHDFNIVTAVVRLLFSVMIGFAIGFGRSRKQRSAGLRTYMLTSTGATLTILIALYEYQMLTGAWSPVVEEVGLKFDAMRYAAHVVAGVGFLAAGTIIGIAHQQVRGLTTAIGLFVAACLGIASGAGFYECVIIAAAFIILSMEALQPLELAFKRHLRNITIFVEYTAEEDVSVITDAITSLGATIFGFDFETPEKQDGPPSAIVSIRLAKHKASHSAILSAIAELDCVGAVQELIA